MLVYEECFNTVQIAHACLRRIFQYGRVHLLFTYTIFVFATSGTKQLSLQICSSIRCINKLYCTLKYPQKIFTTDRGDKKFNQIRFALEVL